MGRKKKNKSWTLKIIYAVCVLIVFIAGLYYENGYRDVNTFINDLTADTSKIFTTITDNVNNTLTEDGSTVAKTEVPTKIVNGTLQMHLIDVGQRR